MEGVRRNHPETSKSSGYTSLINPINNKAMKNLTYSGRSLALLSALVFLPALTYAQVDINNEASGLLDASVDLDAVATDTLLDIEAGVEVGIDSATSVEMESGSDASVGSDLRLNADGVAVTSVTEVNSDADLQVFAANLAAREERVDEIKAEETTAGEAKVEVVYRHSGRLLGIVPVTIKSTTLVTAANNRVEAESRLPWWSFLVAEKNYAKAEIESRIRDNPTIMTSAEVEANAAIKAEIIRAVVAELNAHSSMNTTVNR